MPLDRLKAIVYVSSCVLPMTPVMLEELLLEARRLNRESGVTGALIYSDGTFMQYFEGADNAVAQTYDRILRSRKHSRVVEMMNTEIDRREFPDWQMGLAQPSPSELLAISTANWVVQNMRSATRGQRSVGMTMLRNFWERRERGL